MNWSLVFNKIIFMINIEAFLILNILALTFLLLFNCITVPVHSLIHWTISVIDDEKENFVLIGKNPYIKNIGVESLDGE
jgi:hypothetical protein